MASFSHRVAALPTLGVGVSTEYGAGDAPSALDVQRLRAEHPRYAAFLEVGVETARGLDRHAAAWAAKGWPTTYHYLDVNLDEREDVGDRCWLEEVRRIAGILKPAWMCGDAGMWHMGRREHGHMLLLPPVLTADSADRFAEGIALLREATGCEVFPENPPGQIFVGDLHILDFFARVIEQADTGMLLDCAHLAIYQRLHGHPATTGLDGFPLEKVVEMHVAGGSLREEDGFSFVEDDHVAFVLPETWQIFERAAASARNWKAVVFECERNSLEACLPGFQRITAAFPA